MPVLAIVGAAVLVFIDQLLKLLVVNTIKIGGPVTVLDPLLRFVYVENKGAAFGMLENQRWIFITLTAVVMVVFIGGGIGNLIDRIFLGYVVDYIQLSFFPPVCNFADYCITFGTVLLVVYLFFVSDFFKNIHEKEELEMTEQKHE